MNKEVPSSDEDQFSLDAKDSNVEDEVSGNKAMTFSFEELSVSTWNFRSDCLLGEGCFGKVYKGLINIVNQVYKDVSYSSLWNDCLIYRLLQSRNLIGMMLKELESLWWKSRHEVSPTIPILSSLLDFAHKCSEAISLRVHATRFSWKSPPWYNCFLCIFTE